MMQDGGSGGSVPGGSQAGVQGSAQGDVQGHAPWKATAAGQGLAEGLAVADLVAAALQRALLRREADIVALRAALGGLLDDPGTPRGTAAAALARRALGRVEPAGDPAAGPPA